MRRHHSGSGRRSVIPTDWAAHHRPVAEGTMTAQVALRAPGTVQRWSDEAEEMVAAPRPPYAERPCRAQSLSADRRPVVAAEDPEAVAGYLLTVPADITVTEGDLAVATDTDDPALDGRLLRVEQVVRGSLRFERDLFCSLTT